MCSGEYYFCFLFKNDPLDYMPFLCWEKDLSGMREHKTNKVTNIALLINDSSLIMLVNNFMSDQFWCPFNISPATHIKIHKKHAKLN